MTSQRTGFMDFVTSINSIVEERSKFTAAFKKEVKNYETYRKAIRNKKGKVKLYKFTEDFKPYLKKSENENEIERKEGHDDDNMAADEKEGQNTQSTLSARPKRRAAEKCQVSVKKQYEFENCKKKLRRPDSEMDSETSCPAGTLTRSALPVIVESPNGISREPDEQPTLQPVVVLDKLSHEDVLRFVQSPEPSFKGFPDETVTVPGRISVADSVAVRTSVKRPASTVEFESPRRKTLKLIGEPSRDGKEIQDLRQPGERRATRSRTKVLNKPPEAESLEIPELRIDAAEKSENPPNAPSATRVRVYEAPGSMTHVEVNTFKTPNNLKFVIGTAHTTGGAIKDKENFPKIILSSGKMSYKQPLKNSNKQRIIGSAQTVSKPVIRTEKTVKGTPQKSISAVKDALLMERKKRIDEAKRMAELKRKEKLERVRREQLEKKQLNELKARKAEERRVAHEQARNARIEQQNEEMRKAGEMRHKEMVEAMKMQQLRKKLEKEKNPSAKTEIKSANKPAARKNENECDDIGLVCLNSPDESSPSRTKKVARWAEPKSHRFQVASLAQGLESEIVLRKMRTVFQPPAATLDTQKIFGRFARVRPRTSSAVWNETLALDAL